MSYDYEADDAVVDEKKKIEDRGETRGKHACKCHNGQHG